MVEEPLQVLHAAARRVPGPSRPRVVLAGAHGALGAEVLQRLSAASAFGPIEVLAREAITPGVQGVTVRLVPGDDPAAWPPVQADIGVVLFDAPRMFHQRERALWVPEPPELLPLARWLHASGVPTLAVVLPHAPGRLPEALKRGLAGLDEHAVATLGFERVLFLRSAQRPAALAHRDPLTRLAEWMLSISRYMIPQVEQPVRAAKVAELLAVALRVAPPGVHIAGPEVVWQAAQGEVEPVARAWLGIA